MTPWWEQYPERLQYELEALRGDGIHFEEPKKNNETGTLSLVLEMSFRGEVLRLRAEFPPFFPYVRVEVFAPDLDLKRHQQPFSKNLCLLGRATDNWEVDDTLAGMLKTQLPRLFDAVAEENAHAAEGLEEEQGEPFSYYYEYLQNSMVLVDSAWKIDPNAGRGRFQLEIESVSPFRARVVQVEDAQSRVLAETDWASGGKVIIGRWARAEDEVRSASAKGVLKAAEFLDAQLREPRWQGGIDVFAILYPEETEWRSRSTGWLFVLRVRHEKPRPGFRPGHSYETHLLRSGRAGMTDLESRVPELRTLRGKRVALLGTGALGGPMAIELARSGLDLNLMDNDIVEPGNSVRWPLGLAAAGLSKVDALKEFISKNFPYVATKSFLSRLGTPPVLGGATTVAKYDEFFDAHLICDCTAEKGLHHPVSELARERGIPYLALSGTPGLWGGRILRLWPDREKPCWCCTTCWLKEGKIPSPPSDPDGEASAIGCAEPVFTGPNYNALQISAFGVRFAVDTLNPSEFDFDLGNVAFKTDAGVGVPPTWTTYKLERHPKCENH